MWAVLVFAAFSALTVLTGRAALSAGGPVTVPAPVPPPRHPVVFMNPRSGGGKVERFHLAEKARELGTDAVTAGAARHDMPFMVVPAGTRNHFALDLGRIAGRAFVNNDSFGAYAAIVQSPAYRDGKVRTSLRLLTELLTHHQGPRLSVRAGNVLIEAPQAVLVSNTPYQGGDPTGFGRRERLDAGVLGVLAVTVASAAPAAGLLPGRRGRGLSMLTASEVVIDSESGEIPVGVDGEALTLPTPVICGIQPGGLRVRVPCDHRRPPPHLPTRRLFEFTHTRRRDRVESR